MLWRIVKVNKDNQITLILDNPITYLANGKGKDFKSSYITKWLNKKNLLAVLVLLLVIIVQKIKQVFLKTT